LPYSSSSGGRSNTWRIDINCAFPDLTATRFCFYIFHYKPSVQTLTSEPIYWAQSRTKWWFLVAFFGYMS